MITFRNSKDSIGANCFVVPKRSNIQDALKYFGYVEQMNNGEVTIVWFKRLSEDESIVIDEESANTSFKVVKPYYENDSYQGEVWKESYSALISNFMLGRVNGAVKTEPICFRKKVYADDKIEIICARVAVDNKLKVLSGVVIGLDTNSTNPRYIIRLDDGKQIILNRSQFKLIENDEYTLINILCPYCNK